MLRHFVTVAEALFALRRDLVAGAVDLPDRPRSPRSRSTRSYAVIVYGEGAAKIDDKAEYGGTVYAARICGSVCA